jgi:uncharacterized protein YyaL (SSP411 family)
VGDPAKGANRLSRESSPYLRLHAGNPVDWYPWGPEAIEAARRDDKPIFLSVGYSTCYWCHVMERESFSDPAVAAEMNRGFVNVKVDREERPDLDEIYMLGTQLLTGQGGWPNSVFLTPKLEPFFAGTYFPPSDRGGRPGFPTVLRSMAHAWETRRADVEAQAGELAAAIRHHLEEPEPDVRDLSGGELAGRALEGLRRRFDGTWGGFGEAPKFPTPSNLWLLAELAPRRVDAAMMLVATLDGMARGGIFDQLGGGFHRYSTDREWRVPHFEKMLYDNGLLLEIFAGEHARSGSPESRRVALETAEFIGREMTAPEGAFWSAIDAETDGREGAYYVWTRAELERALGEEDAVFLAPLLGFAGDPFFEGDGYVLHLPRPLDVAARERRISRDELLAEAAPLRAKLLEARSQRRRPATDDKILADWNGTAIAGLAEAGRVLARPDLVERAGRAAEFLLSTLRSPAGVLLHSWRAGEGRIEAFLADYVFLVRGLLRLHRATGAARWLEAAESLQEEQARRLSSRRGGFFNAADAPDLLVRGKELFDGAIPGANGVAALNLLELADATGDGDYAAAAETTLRAFAQSVTAHPDGARTMTLALARLGERAPVVASPSAAGSIGSLAAVRGQRAELGAPDGEGWRTLTVTLEVAPGWHLVADPEPPRLEATGAELEAAELPPAGELPSAAGAPAARGWEGRLAIRARLRDAGPETSLRLRFAACGDGACHPPALLEIPLGG